MDIRAIGFGLCLAVAGGLVVSVIWWVGLLFIVVGLLVLALGFFERS